VERASGYCNACPPFFIRYSTGTTFAATMDLHLADEQAELLLAALDRLIENDRYPLSARIRKLREIRALLKPYPERPPSRGRYKSRR